MAALAFVLLPGACSDGASTPEARGPVTTAAAPTSSTTPFPTAAAWKRGQSAPVARQEVAATAVDGKAWVIGGLEGSTASTRVETYDPITDTWESQPDLPLGLHHAAAAAYRGEVVVVGGFTSGTDLYSQPSDRVLALRNGAWVDLPRLLRPRGAAAAAVVDDALFVVAGRDQTDLIAPTERFDGAAWSDRAAIPVPRDHLAAAAEGNALYAVGGRILAPGDTTGAAERYDPATDAWTRLPEMPTARGGHGMAAAGGQLLAVGGEDAERTFPQVEAFDPATGRWSSLAPLGSARHGLAVASAAASIVALVGGTESGLAPSTVTEILI